MKHKSLKTKYKYGLLYSNTRDLDTDDISMSGYEEVKKSVENP